MCYTMTNAQSLTLAVAVVVELDSKTRSTQTAVPHCRTVLSSCHNFRNLRPLHPSNTHRSCCAISHVTSVSVRLAILMLAGTLQGQMGRLRPDLTELQEIQYLRRHYYRSNLDH